MAALTAPALLQLTVDALREETLPLDTCLDGLCARIDEVEPTVHALLPEEHRRERLGDEAAAAPDGPLAKVPVRTKDMFHITGMPTRAGSQLDPVTLAGPQGTIVDRLRAAGALILAKTVTCEFGFAEPGPTTNPHDPTRTPGGSSSGSAAAVAAGHTPLAIGTQTVDSTVTPAACCGVVGFKPSHRRARIDGMVPFSPAMDHLGMFTQDVAGAGLAASVMCDFWSPAPPKDRPTLAVPVGRCLDRVEPASRDAFETQLMDLAAAGATITEIAALDDFEELCRIHHRLISCEFTQVHEKCFGAFGFRHSDKSRGLCDKGTELEMDVLAEGMQSGARLRADLQGALDSRDADAWVCPATTGPAPRGLDSVGDPAMGLPWTHAQVPAITIPAGTVGSMPVGLQLAGQLHNDEELLAVAHWVEIALSTA